MKSFTSAEDYFDNLKTEIIKSSEHEDPRLVDIMLPKIKDLIDIRWIEYLTGKAESYLLAISEVMKIYDESVAELTQMAIDNLLDKEFIVMHIMENGDIAYSLGPKGKEYVINEIKNNL